jgi:hypothetical protein
MTDSTQEKQQTALDILSRGALMVHLDPRRSDVKVPDRFRTEPVLRLKFAYGFNLAGFQVDDSGVGAWLTFQTERFFCWVPWEAVFALTEPESGDRGRLWVESLPEELLESLATQAQSKRRTRKRPTGKPGLHVVPAAEEDAPGAESTPEEPPPSEGPAPEAELGPEPSPDEPPPTPSRPSRPNLRIVK